MANHEDYLAQEYTYLQKVIEDFDTKTLTVKTWSVTFSAAGIGFAYDKGVPVLLVVAALSAMAFGFVECLMKVNQQAYYARINQIEGHFSGAGNTPAFQIGTEWEREFKRSKAWRRVWTVMTWPHVWMPHLPIAVIAGILLLAAPPDHNSSEPSPQAAVKSQ